MDLATLMQDTKLSSPHGFAYYLDKLGILNHQEGIKALAQAKTTAASFVAILIKRKLINEKQIAKVVAEYYGLPLCDLTAFNFDLIPIQFLHMESIKNRTLLPLFIANQVLYLAVFDPTVTPLDNIRLLTGLDVRLLVVELGQLDQVLDSVVGKLIVSEMELHQPGMVNKVTGPKLAATIASDTIQDVDSAPVVNFVNKIITDAISQGASDIHFEQYANEYRIRYRLHGVLYAASAPPIQLASYLLTRIKIMANIDITEHRIPQDGRFSLMASKFQSIDFRVSVCPTIYGEKIVLRLLDPGQILHNIDELGMESAQQDQLLTALAHTQGLILVTGPTGSGKTVTLYSALRYLNSVSDNIMSVEDPVEMPLTGINQVHVHPKVGLTFATALRSFLRQDPDIIMVGEIRDLETAQIVIQAAQTGHLVLSTLHTNSSAETIARLLSIGVEPYNLASALILVIAQRLLRILCPSCKQPESLPEEILLREGFSRDEIPHLQLYKASSCTRCSHGYTGRAGIFEILTVSEEMKHLIMKNANSLELAAQTKRENIIGLRAHGLAKVKDGTTSLAELNRTFK